MSETAGQGPVPVNPPPASPPAAAAPPAPIGIEDFQKIALRIGTIVDAQPHPNADRLLILKVDIGEASPRQVVAGIKNSYEPSSLIGKHVVVVANLKSAMLRGMESQGMVLAASDGASLVLISPEKPIRPGSTVK